MAGDDITFSGWVALIALVLTGIGWAGGWAFARGRDAQSTEDHHGQIGHIQDALNEKERRVDALGERVARIEASVEHMNGNIKRADNALAALADKIEAMGRRDG
jgi:septal ring factor EnvC (AmiA/AmiB activator)